MSLLQNCNVVAFKHLSNVEIDSYGSNQHELHGARAFKDIFGYNKSYFSGKIYYITNSGTSSVNTELTWYDAREHAYNNRSEYRFYYTYEISNFRPTDNDILMVSKNNLDEVIIIIINNSNINSCILNNLHLFKDYTYTNGASYISDVKNVPFLTKLL